MRWIRRRKWFITFTSSALLIIGGAETLGYVASKYQATPFTGSKYEAVPENGDCRSAPTDLHLKLHVNEIRRYNISGEEDVYVTVTGDISQYDGTWSNGYNGDNSRYVLKNGQPILVGYVVNTTQGSGSCALTIKLKHSS